MKKVIAMSLAMCMTAGMLAGCGNSTTAQSTEEKQEQSSSTAETSEKEEPTEINLMVYAPENFDPATFPSVKAIEEACNVKLNYAEHIRMASARHSIWSVPCSAFYTCQGTLRKRTIKTVH